MDPIVAVLCLVSGIAIPVVIVSLIVRRAHRQLSTAGAYREVAQGLGLVVDTRGCSLHGIRDDRPLWVGEVLVGEGAEKHREVHGVIGLARPLALGLDIRRRRSRRAHTQGLDDEELDKRLTVRVGFEDALPCVRSEPVRHALEALSSMVNDVVVTDERVRVRMKRSPSRPAALGALVDRLEALAAALESCRTYSGAAPDLNPWLTDWRAVAGEWSLNLDDTRPSLMGRLGGWPVEVVPASIEGVWFAWLIVRFDPDTDTGLQISTRRTTTGKPADGQHILSGDEAFDRAFVVKGYDPWAVRKRLDAGVRAALISLNGIAHVSLDDHRLVVRRLSHTRIAEALSHALIVAEQVAPAGGEPRVIDVV